MSKSMVTSALVIATLVASPALAQRQRHPGGGGGEGGWQRGGGQVQDRGGRPSPAAQDGGGRGEAQGRGGRPGGDQQPRQYAAPPQEYRQPQVQERGGTDTGRYAVPRDQAQGANRYGTPGYAGQGRPDGRPYQSPGYANRGYSGRYVDPGYNRGYDPRYDNRGYYNGRSYAVPRYGPRPYAYNSYRGYAYTSPRYYAPRGYVSPYWRGSWGGGWGGVTVVTPRFIYPNVIGYGAWQPYVYRPSLGIGVYYGADGLYPFGTIPPAFYDPTPGIAYGGLRITDAPRDAQVFADGYYVGIVDDFDGVFQHLNLEPGPHRVEIHHPGFAPIAFDVDIQPGRTITLRADVY